jgi:hypothetical protein
MESSASAPSLPVLSNEDYKIPSNGVGDTGHPNRVTHGAMSKDKGTFSSRINQIQRQAAKVPGPGMYVAHDDWKLKGGNKFPNGNREYKPMSKTPAPPTYETKNFGTSVSIATNEFLSNRPRIVLGKMPKGNRRSFLESAVKHGSAIPAPGTYTTTNKRGNQLDTSGTTTSIKVLDWKREMQKSKGTGAPEKEIGPDHYTINYKHCEDAPNMISVPKALSQNFLDKAVKEKWVDVKSKKECPGPGTYNVHNFDDSRISRGTKYLQTRGLSRNSVSGFF